MVKINRYKKITLAALILSTSAIAEAHITQSGRYAKKLTKSAPYNLDKKFSYVKSNITKTKRHDKQLETSVTSYADRTFPYGKAPKGELSQGADDRFQPPEALLGSWAMLKAVENDKDQLPTFLQDNVVYGMGTAPIGKKLGMSDCDKGGCYQLLGPCFALKFKGKKKGPKYMIFQSVETAAWENRFDVDMAGGGEGLDKGHCEEIWGDNGVPWEQSIEDFTGPDSCGKYFKNLKHSDYKVTYDSKTYYGKDTIINSCKYAAANDFNNIVMESQRNIPVVPVTCPTGLTQVSGLRLKPLKKIGNAKIIPLKELTEDDFSLTKIKIKNITQNQDCSPPSGSWRDNIKYPTEKNYGVVISTTKTEPHLSEK